MCLMRVNSVSWIKRTWCLHATWAKEKYTLSTAITINNTQQECVYSINRIYSSNDANIVQDDDLIHNCLKRFCEYDECINGENQEISMPMNDINCLKKSTNDTEVTNGK